MRKKPRSILAVLAAGVMAFSVFLPSAAFAATSEPSEDAGEPSAISTQYSEEEKVNLDIKMSIGYESPDDAPDDFIFQMFSNICAFPGSKLTYSFTIDNENISENRHKASHNIVLSDVLPEEFELKAATPGYEWNAETRTISWKIDEISGYITNKKTYSFKVELKEPMLRAGWTNYATATCENGKQESYKSVPKDSVSSELAETLLYSYYVYFYSNGGTDNEDGLPFYLIRLNDLDGKYNENSDPNFELDFPGDWYTGRSAGSWGGDPTPDPALGENVIFAGWSKSAHEGVQTVEPDDMVATIKENELSGSITIKNGLSLYAVWANDTNKNGTPDYLDPVNVDALNEQINRTNDLVSSDYTNYSAVKQALQRAKTILEKGNLSLENQKQVDTAAEELKAAIDKLVVKQPETKGLSDAIKAADTLSAADYKDFSVVKTALKEAKAVLASKDSKQSDVDRVLQKLVNAVNSLEHVHKRSSQRAGATSASCTQKGYSGDIYCTVCGEILERGTYTNATGHNFVNGRCTGCGISEMIYDANTQPTKPANNKGYKTGEFVNGIGEETEITPDSSNDHPVTLPEYDGPAVDDDTIDNEDSNEAVVESPEAQQKDVLPLAAVLVITLAVSTILVGAICYAAYKKKSYAADTEDYEESEDKNAEQ